jgi:hypothetical protein
MVHEAAVCKKSNEKSNWGRFLQAKDVTGGLRRSEAKRDSTSRKKRYLQGGILIRVGANNERKLRVPIGLGLMQSD